MLLLTQRLISASNKLEATLAVVPKTKPPIQTHPSSPISKLHTSTLDPQQ